MSYLAQVTYTGNGSTTGYALPFSYIASSHVKAFINNVSNTAFTISGSTLTFTSAPANSAVIRLERQTPTDARLVDFTDGSVLTEAQLDQSADQNFFIAQETSDSNQASLLLGADDKFDALSKVIKNVANPVNANDAVNKTYLENKMFLETVDKYISEIPTSMQRIDRDMAHEIIFVGDNDAMLYKAQYTMIIRNLLRKEVKGIFNYNKGIKLLRYWVDNVVKMSSNSV